MNISRIDVRKNVVDLQPEEWELSQDVSLKGQYLIARYSASYLVKSGAGSIISTGSGRSFKGGENSVLFFANDLPEWVTGAHLATGGGCVA